jgi:hypothetical protein
MTRTEIHRETAAALPSSDDERQRTLAEIVHDWADETARPVEDGATRADIAEGVAQGGRGEYAMVADVAESFARFRR